MLTYGGYTGKVIKIDLSSETISEYPWSDQERAQYLGGKAMAARLLLDHLMGKETAFSEENWIVLATGPLTGSGAPGSSRFDMASLSPKDDLPAFSNCGGNFGVHLKKAGYDALILSGRCREPRWLEINGDEIRFHDGTELWGRRTGPCQEELARLLGISHFGRLCIGPAGENLVKFASVIGDGHAAGRAGLGAVLGYKNLKAITVTGSGRISLHDPGKAAAWNREWHEYLRRCSRGAVGGGSNPSCGSCPLRCSKHLHVDRGSVLNELGMDVIAAEDVVSWAEEQGIPTQGLYEDIAYRRGFGSKLADGVPHRKGKGGKRRGGSYGAIAEAFCLPPDAPETEVFCRDLTEAISAAGQCMFTVNALRPAAPVLHILPILQYVTGMELTLEDLLRVGRNSRELEQQLIKRFVK